MKNSEAEKAPLKAMDVLMKHNPKLLTSKYSIEYGVTPFITAMEEWKSYHSEPLIKEIEELKTELDEFREAAIIDIKENHSLEQQIEALKKENEQQCKTILEIADKAALLQRELTALKSQKEPLMEGVKSAEDFLKEYKVHTGEAYLGGMCLPRKEVERMLNAYAAQFKQSQEGKQVDVEALLKKIFEVFYDPTINYIIAEERVKEQFTSFFTIRGREWISVEDRLPEEQESVLISVGKFQRELYKTIGYYVNEKWFFENDKEIIEGLIANPQLVTHWMPLPEPPKV